MTKKIGIIGAGIAGLTVGNKLTQKGFQVEIFDKGRAVGGRTSSRKTEWGYLDHGAQYITLRDSEFKAFIKAHLPPDLLLAWQANFARLEDDKITPEDLEELRYVPRHSMSTLCKYLAVNLSVKTQIKIAKLNRDNYWILEDSHGHHYGPFDLIVITAPPAQTAALLSYSSFLREEIAKVEMWPCWTLMLITENKWKIPFGGIKCNNPILGWIALNNSKPERGQLNSIILQANWQWSAENIDRDRQAIGEILQQEAERILGVNFSSLKYKAVHLWRYAAPKNVAQQPYFFDQTSHLAVCGDWCVAGRIEGAFLSASALSEALFSIND
jgi:predicted NAD/FAD-dependent oxidoreductase